MQKSTRHIISLVLLGGILMIVAPFTVKGKAPVSAGLAAHHGIDRFINPYRERPQEWKDFRRWISERTGESRKTAKDLLAQVPMDPVRLEDFHDPKVSAQATWLGHSTVLLQIDGVNILTDPIFSKRASPVPFAGPARVQPPAVSIEDLPDIHYAVLSHNHYDHLDRWSVRQLGRDLHWFVPLGVADWFHKLGHTKVTEMDWWQEAEVEKGRIVSTPSQHFSGRKPWSDVDKSLWASWLIEIDSVRFWFGGDTGYNDVQFKEIGEAFEEIHMAAIPIGAYKPIWFMGPVHVSPAEAIQIHEDIGARQSFGVHWGTYLLADDLLTEPMDDIKTLKQAEVPGSDSFDIFPLGKTVTIESL
jgi:N-acyl-phosphatidylethanolamine-hydrolysing phospholipase D